MVSDTKGRAGARHGFIGGVNEAIILGPSGTRILEKLIIHMGPADRQRIPSILTSIKVIFGVVHYSTC